MHVKIVFTTVVALFLSTSLTIDGHQSSVYHGILINGQFGTQLYDPFNEPHAQGNLPLGLPTANAAWGSSAVLYGPFAYFADATGEL
jgi:hypothetical protein